jgi:enoyl-CoA hydratase
VRGPAAWITLNRPEKLNAITFAMNDAVISALDEAAGTDAVKVVVLNGAGRAFSAGHDLTEEVTANVDGAFRWHRFLEDHFGVVERLLTYRKPLIARVSGFCLGGGFEFALACDLIIASEDAKFGHVEIRYGSGPVTMVLPFLIHDKKAREMLLTGDTISAEDARNSGFVNHVVPMDELDGRIDAIVAKIAPTPLPVLEMTKLGLWRASESRGLMAAVKANLTLSAILNSAETPEQTEFDRIATEQGLGAAMTWRDSRYVVDGEPHVTGSKPV